VGFQTFLSWLLSQTNRDDPIGDLARDFQADSARPATNASIEEIRTYLEDLRVSDAALRALDRAIEEYIREMCNG